MLSLLLALFVGLTAAESRCKEGGVHCATDSRALLVCDSDGVTELGAENCGFVQQCSLRRARADAHVRGLGVECVGAGQMQAHA